MSASLLLERAPDELGSRALAVAATIRERGARTVALSFSDPDQLIASVFGTLAADAIAVPIDRRLHPKEIDRILHHASVDLVLGDALHPSLSKTTNAARANPPGAALVLYTSGSTSRPKAVVLDERALLSNADAWNARYRVTGDDTVLSALSPCHSFGITIAIATVLAGARHAIVARPSPAAIAADARRLRPTILLAVSSTFAHLARSSSASREDFESARALMGGASPLPIPIIEALNAKLGHRVHLTYGLTEAGPVVTANPPEDNRIGTVGTALAGVDLRVAEDGELCVRGPSIMRGYLGDEAATRDALDGGWLHTGDLAAIDDGYVRILGRKRDLIIRAGEKISPQEIEEVLIAHPAVRDAAVVGVTEDGVDEALVACVVLDGATIGELDLGAHCARHLAAFKVPRIFRVFDELPRNPNGKLMRGSLLESMKSE